MASGNRTVGIVTGYLGDEYGRLVVDGAIQRLRSERTNAICFVGGAVSEDTHPEAAIYQLIAGNVQGLIVDAGTVAPDVESLSAFCRSFRGLPVVTTGVATPERSGVVVDNRGGIRAAMRHLFQEGRRRIAYVHGPSQSAEDQQRFDAYVEMLDELRLPFDPRLVAAGAFRRESGERAVAYFVDEQGLWPDAIIAANDLTAAGALQALQLRGLRIPADVALVGFDDRPDSQCSDPAITSVRQPIFEMGQRAADLLLAALAGRREREQVLLRTELVIRASSRGTRCEQTCIDYALNCEQTSRLPERLRSMQVKLAQVLANSLGRSPDESASLLHLVECIVKDLLTRELQGVNMLRPFVRAYPEELTRWQGAMSELASVLGEVLADKAEFRRHAELWFAMAGNLIATEMLSMHRARLLESEGRGEHLTEFCRDLITVTDLRGIAQAIDTHFPGLGPSSYHLALLEKPGTSATLVASSGLHDASHGPEQRKFVLGRLHSSGLLPRAEPFVAHAVPLQDGQTQLGFLLTEGDTANWLFLRWGKQVLEAAIGRVLRQQSPGPGRVRSEDSGTRALSRLGRYEILRSLGTGGAATVYLAQAPVVGWVSRPVAIKLLHEAAFRDSDILERQFMDEAKLSASIRHPNVVEVYEIGQDAAGTFLVMQYVEGASLAALLEMLARARRPMPPSVVLRIAADALAGLHAAHELVSSDGTPLRLVHRDFTPQNILVGTDGVSRLSDFGIAVTTASRAVTATNVVKGKVRYMSPEQAKGEALDRRADIWAAGAVLWELFAGRRLHSEPVDAAVLLKIIGTSAPRLRDAVPSIPDAVDRVVAHALAIARTDRPPTAEHLRLALLEAAAGFARPADHEEVGAFVRHTLELPPTPSIFPA